MVSTPNRRRLASQPCWMCFRERPSMFGPSPMRLKTLVASTTCFHLGIFPQGLAGDLLAHAQRVHVGGVEEVDSGLDGLAEEGHGRLFFQDPGPPLGTAVAHAAQAEAGDFDAGAAEISVLHGEMVLEDG